MKFQLFLYKLLHIPKSVRPLAQILAKELQHACKDGLWGFVCLHMFPKAVLCTPSCGKKKYYVVKETLSFTPSNASSKETC